MDIVSDINIGKCQLRASDHLPHNRAHALIASHNSYQDGISAASASTIKTDASVTAKYMAVSVDMSTKYSTSKIFDSTYQYALFSFRLASRIKVTPSMRIEF